MKIPKIQWDFFPVEYRTFSVDTFFMSLSLRKRLITGEQNIDPQSMDQSTLFDELFKLKNKKNSELAGMGSYFSLREVQHKMNFAWT